MELGMIGLGKMGAFMTERLVQAVPQGGWVRSELSGRAAGRRDGR
jgi:6-phosphogluconate dehydrogenase (decarboxylating)